MPLNAEHTTYSASYDPALYGYGKQPAYRTRDGLIYYNYPYYNGFISGVGDVLDFGPHYNTYNYARGAHPLGRGYNGAAGLRRGRHKRG